MKKMKILIVITFLLLSSGCYNYRELNELSIVSAFGIDKDEDNKYKVTIQVINSQKENTSSSDSSSSTKFVTYTSSGKTLQEAIRKSILTSPKRLFATQMQILVISEECAKEDLTKFTDIFFRNPETQMNFITLIARNTSSKKILATMTPQETINAKNIRQSLESDTKYLGVGFEVTFEDLVNRILSKNIEVALPSVVLINKKGYDEMENLEKTKKIANAKISNIAVFKSEKLVGYLSEKESIGFSFIQNEVNNTIVTVKCNKENYLSAEVIDSKTKTSYKDQKITINVIANANISENNCMENLNSIKKLNKIQKKLENNIKKNIKKTINKAIFEYNSDIFGFKDLIYKSNPKFFKTIKSKDEYLKNLDYEIKVNIKSLEKGYTLYTTERNKNERIY